MKKSECFYLRSNADIGKNLISKSFVMLYMYIYKPTGRPLVPVDNLHAPPFGFVIKITFCNFLKKN